MDGQTLPAYLLDQHDHLLHHQGRSCPQGCFRHPQWLLPDPRSDPCSGCLQVPHQWQPALIPAAASPAALASAAVPLACVPALQLSLAVAPATHSAHHFFNHSVIHMSVCPPIHVSCQVVPPLNRPCTHFIYAYTSIHFHCADAGQEKTQAAYLYSFSWCRLSALKRFAQPAVPAKLQ